MAKIDQITAGNPVPTTSPNNDAYWDWETNENSTWDGTTNGKSPEENNPDYNGGKKSSDWSNDPLADFSKWNGDVLGYFTYMAKTYGGQYNDRLMNYIESEGSATAAREWTANREDTQYQRLVEDLKAAGINPYILLQNGATPVSSSSSGNSYNGSYYTTEQQKKLDRDQKWAQLILSIVSSVIMIAAFA